MIKHKRLMLPAISFCPGFKPGTLRRVHEDTDKPISYDNLTVFDYFDEHRDIGGTMAE